MDRAVFVVLQTHRVHGEFVRGVCGSRERAEMLVAGVSREGVLLRIVEERLLE